MKLSHEVPRKLKALTLLEAGTAAVELALLLPILLLLAIGVADYARAFATAITVANAAKAGAQFGAQSIATSGDTAGMNQAARQDALDAGTITVTSSRICRCPDESVVNCVTGTCGAYGAPKVFVSVIASNPVTTIFNYPGLPSTIPVTRTAILRVQ